MEMWTMDMEIWTWRHGLGDRTWRRGHGNMEVWTMDMETWTWRHGLGDRTWRQGHRDMGLEIWTWDQAIFKNPFTGCSACKRNVNVCPFVDEKTNESDLCANGLNGLNGLAHL
jgi:hypothetical protein